MPDHAWNVKCCVLSQPEGEKACCWGYVGMRRSCKKCATDQPSQQKMNEQKLRSSRGVEVLHLLGGKLKEVNQWLICDLVVRVEKHQHTPATCQPHCRTQEAP